MTTTGSAPNVPRGSDAWAMLKEVRSISRTQTGALVSEALRVWYNSLPAEDADDPADAPR